MDILSILELLGGIVLFLFGIEIMGESLKKISGGKMEQILQNLTSNKWKGALLGCLVTAVIQSSGATIVMVVGFVNSQIMTLQQAVGVIMGSNIGTTVTAWLLSLSSISSDNLVLQLIKPKNFCPILGLVGLGMMIGGKKQHTKDIGTGIAAFATLMLGMNTMSNAMSPLSEDPAFTSMLTAFSNPFLGLLVGLVVTAILQSSSASIGILQAMSLSGTMKMSSAIPVLMGENIGSAITGILGSIGASRNARRAAWFQMVYCILKTMTFMALFYGFNAIFHFGIMDEIASPVKIAIFHSVFNIIAVLVYLPISDFLLKIVYRMIPVTEQEKEESENRKELQLLDPRYVTSSSFALKQCRTVINRMADFTEEAVKLSTGVVLKWDEEQARRVEQLEVTVDEYEDTLNSYLMQLTGKNYSTEDSQLFTLMIHSIGDLERMTDHTLNIVQCAQQMAEKKQSFSSKAIEEISVFNNALNDIVSRTVKAFKENDLNLASTVEPLEEVIDGLNMQIKKRHARRVRRGKCSIELGVVLEDITTDYERIADHCNNIAVYMTQTRDSELETHGYLEHLEESDRLEFREMAYEFEQQYQLPNVKKDDDDAPADNQDDATRINPEDVKKDKKAKDSKDKDKSKKKKQKA